MLSSKEAKFGDTLEKIIHAFFNVKHVAPVRIEKYRQDGRDVTATWQMGEDPITRNISVSISLNARYISLETNAWIDDTATHTRKWYHQKFGTHWIEKHSTRELTIALAIMLEHILHNVLFVKETDLTLVAPLI